MALITIEQLKHGDYFQLSGGKSILVFDGYNRHTKKYDYHKFDNINHTGAKKKGTTININFEF